MNPVCEIPGIGTITRPARLTCRECGEWLENAVEYATCPHGHGKRLAYLDKGSLRQIREMKSLERFARHVAELPVVHRCSGSQHRVPGVEQPCRVSRIKFTAENLVKAIKRGRIIARLDSSTGPLSIMTRVKPRGVAHPTGEKVAAKFDGSPMKQYADLKIQYPDALLAFRTGDFYEFLYDDAKVAAKALHLTLTTRHKGTADPVPMCGFPHHALEAHLRTLIKDGHRVAICERVEPVTT